MWTDGVENASSCTKKLGPLSTQTGQLIDSIIQEFRIAALGML